MGRVQDGGGEAGGHSSQVTPAARGGVAREEGRRVTMKKESPIAEEGRLGSGKPHSLGI